MPAHKAYYGKVSEIIEPLKDLKSIWVMEPPKLQRMKIDLS
jgi:hypothetical protein